MKKVRERRMMGLKRMNRGQKRPWGFLHPQARGVGNCNGTQGRYLPGNPSIRIVTERGDLICTVLGSFAFVLAE